MALTENLHARHGDAVAAEQQRNEMSLERISCGYVCYKVSGTHVTTKRLTKPSETDFQQSRVEFRTSKFVLGIRCKEGSFTAHSPSCQLDQYIKRVLLSGH
jgi:hypothetical protein